MHFDSVVVELSFERFLSRSESWREVSLLIFFILNKVSCKCLLLHPAERFRHLPNNFFQLPDQLPQILQRLLIMFNSIDELGTTVGGVLQFKENFDWRVNLRFVFADSLNKSVLVHVVGTADTVFAPEIEFTAEHKDVVISIVYLQNHRDGFIVYRKVLKILEELSIAITLNCFCPVLVSLLSIFKRDYVLLPRSRW